MCWKVNKIKLFSQQLVKEGCTGIGAALVKVVTFASVGEFAYGFNPKCFHFTLVSCCMSVLKLKGSYAKVPPLLPGFSPSYLCI